MIHKITKNDFAINFETLEKKNQTKITLTTKGFFGYHFITLSSFKNATKGSFTVLSFRINSKIQKINETKENFLENCLESYGERNGIPYLPYNGFSTFYIFDKEKFNKFLINDTITVRVGVNYFAESVNIINSTIFPQSDDAYDFEINFKSNLIGFEMPVRNRVEYYHPVPYIMTISGYSVGLFLSILFYFSQPSKSHGFLPIVANVFLLIRVIGRFTAFTSYEFQKDFHSIFGAVTFAPAIFAQILLIPVNLIRFLLLNEFSKRKSRYNFEKGGKIQLQLLKFTSYPIVGLFVAVSLFTSLMILFFCAKLIEIDIYIFLVTAFCILVVTLLIMTIDIIIFNIRYLKVAKTKIEFLCFAFLSTYYAWKGDVFSFRFQIYFLYLGITVPLWLLSAVFQMLEVHYAIILANAILLEFCFFFTQSGFLMVLSIINAIRVSLKAKAKKNYETFDDMLTNPDLYQLFHTFATLGNIIIK